MSQDYGIPAPGAHHAGARRAAARYLVLIDSAGGRVARLFDASRAPVGEFDAGTEEVAQMTQGLIGRPDAAGAEWDAALAGQSRAERIAAEVYTLDV